MTEENKQKREVVVTLQERRSRRNQQVAQQAKPLEDRIRELELELAKTSDLVLILNESIDQLEARSWKMLRLLRKLSGEE